MLIFDQDLESQEEVCEFRVTEETKSFLIAFFGFYPHHAVKRFESFILETGIVDMSNHGDVSMEEFVLDGKFGIQVHDQCDRRTFDPTIVLPKLFKSKTEAINWFKEILKKSAHFSEKEISVFDVIDGDKLVSYIERETCVKNKKIKARKKIDNELKHFKRELLENYEDDELAIEWINKKIPDLD